MPRDIAIVLPGRRVNASEIATAITVASALISSGRHVAFYHGYDALPELAKTDEDGRWTHGIILVGPLADTIGVVDLADRPGGGRSRPGWHARGGSGRRLAGVTCFRRQCRSRRPFVR